MRPQTIHQLGQLDAWVLSTYQRLETLDVPVFDVTGGSEIRPLDRRTINADLHLLPTRLPGEIASFSPWLATGQMPGAERLKPAERLSLLLRYLAAPIRYEPSGESRVHKAVPSARCLFPLDFYFLSRGEEGLRAWRYVPAFHALQPVPVPAGTAAPAEGDALLCVARIWSIAEKYGDFADFPPVLEAGHAFAQLGYLAQSLGFASGEAVDREAVRPLCKGAFELPLFGFGLDLSTVDIDSLERRSARIGSDLEGEGLAERFPRLAEMHRLFDAGAGGARYARPSAGTGAPELAAPDDDLGLLEAFRRRNAGNDRSGTAAALIEADPGLLSSLIETWTRIRARRPSLNAEAELRLSIAWTASGATPAGLYGIDGTPQTEALPRGEFLRRLGRMLPYRGMRINLSTLAATIIIQADVLEAIDRHGDCALRDIHLAAGAAAQDFSLAASAHGLFARPVRMMREASLEAALPLDGQVVYQVLCGFARRSNLTMELL